MQIVNQRDIRLQSADTRLSTVGLHGNVVVSPDQVEGLEYVIDGTRVLSISSECNIFSVQEDGLYSPAYVKLRVTSKNITNTPSILVLDGVISTPLALNNGVIDIPFASLTTQSATVKVVVTQGGVQYSASIQVAKVVEGSGVYQIVLNKGSCYVQADAMGNVMSYYAAKTTARAFYGSKDVTLASTFSVVSNTGGLGWTIDQQAGVLQVVGGASQDTSPLTLRGTYLTQQSDAQFVVHKTKAPTTTKMLVLSPSSNVVRLGRDGVWTPATITFKVASSNIEGDIEWSVSPSLPYTASLDGSSISVQSSSMGNLTGYSVTASADGFTDVVDITKIPSLEDSLPSYTVVLSNENHTVSAAYDGAVSDLTGAYTDISVYKDGDIDSGSWSFDASATVGVVTTTSGARVRVTSLTSDAVAIPIVCTRKDVDNALYEQEDVTSSAWGKARVVVRSAQILSPEGLERVWKISETTANGTHALSGKCLLAGDSTYTFSVRMKKAEREKVRLTANSVYADFSLSNGSVTNITATSAGSRPLGDDWWLVWIVFSSPPSQGDAYCSILLMSGGSTSYTGTDESGLYISGGKVNLGAIVGVYSPQPSPITKTFSVSKVKSAISFSVVVESDHGNVIRVGEDVPYTLTARVFANGEEVTATIPPAYFKWTKKSMSDVTGDAAWNAAHASGYKSVIVSGLDVNSKTNFSCTIESN